MKTVSVILIALFTLVHISGCKKQEDTIVANGWNATVNGAQIDGLMAAGYITATNTLSVSLDPGISSDALITFSIAHKDGSQIQDNTIYSLADTSTACSAIYYRSPGVFYNNVSGTVQIISLNTNTKKVRATSSFAAHNSAYPDTVKITDGGFYKDEMAIL